MGILDLIFGVHINIVDRTGINVHGRIVLTGRRLRALEEAQVSCASVAADGPTKAMPFSAHRRASTADSDSIP